MRYKTLVADPPWQYHNKLDMSDGVNRSAMSQYATMDLNEVKTFLHDTNEIMIHREVPDPRDELRQCRKFEMLEDMIAEDAHLYLWVTNPFLIDGSAVDVARAWGFQPKQLITWVKGRLSIDTSHPDYDEAKLVKQIGMGRYWRGCTEHMLFCTRGTAMAMVKDRGVPNCFVAPRGRHSEKPDEAYELIERVSPGPSLDIFARKRRPRFDAIGDELALESAA